MALNVNHAWPCTGKLALFLFWCFIHYYKNVQNYIAGYIFKLFLLLEQFQMCKLLQAAVLGWCEFISDARTTASHSLTARLPSFMHFAWMWTGVARLSASGAYRIQSGSPH